MKYISICLLLIIIQNVLLLNINLGSNEIKQIKRTLVLLDDWHTVDTHSQFFNQIKNMGYEIDFKVVSKEDFDLSLTYYGEYLYTNIIIMAPSVDLQSFKKSKLNIPELLKYFDDGHDIMIFADKSSNNYIRELANEFGIDFDDYNSKVKDSLYIHSKSDNINTELLQMKDQDIIITDNIVNIPAIFPSPKGNILYEGIGMDIDPANEYVFPLLKASSNTYSNNGKDFYANGERIKLVSAYQGRNNKRVIISGSLNLCSNKFYYLSNTDSENTDYTQSPNGVFCQDLINWNFQRTGVLKYENIRHRRKSDGLTMSEYRIREEIEYLIDIYEYDYKTDSWKPYITDDIQVEYIMLNPYYINQLRLYNPNQPTYYVQFKSPEKHGVFKFVIDYKRPGYSYIFTQTKAPLRPYHHNEYPRYLTCAFPYYLSVFVSMFSFIIFSILFVYGKNSN